MRRSFNVLVVVGVIDMVHHDRCCHGDVSRQGGFWLGKITEAMKEMKSISR